jgi:hypothetical protein
MARKVIRTFDSWGELSEFIQRGAVREPYDEEPFRDLDGNPMTPEQVLELVREIERETGRKLIFRRGERPRAA